MDRRTFCRIFRVRSSTTGVAPPIAAAVAGVLLSWAGTSLATSDLQATTEQAVLTVCGGFVVNDDASTPAQKDLFARCGEMVHNSRELGRIPPGPETNTLGLDNEQLDAAYQQLAGEETSTPGTMATETANIQTAAILSRLATLRGGSGAAVARGPRPGDRGVPALVASLDDAVYLSQAGNTMTIGSDMQRLGLFANADFGFGNKDTTPNEDGFDYNSYGVTAGADYRLTEAFVLGGALGYSRLNADFNKSADVTGGSVDANSYNVFGYGIYTESAFYVQGLLGYTTSSFDIKRRILYMPAPGSTAEGADRTAKADTDGGQFQASVGAGYDVRREALTVTPALRLEYLDADIDSYRESGAQGLNLEVEDQSVVSLTSSLGVHVSYATSQSFGALVPQFRAEWIHQYRDNGRRIKTQYVNDPRNNVLALQTDGPDRDYMLLGAGVSAVFANGVQAFVDYETLQGLSDIESHLITAGVRLEM